MSKRLIYVDDASLLIFYQGGPWAGGDNYSVNTQWGQPLYGALHALSGSGSFTFSFTGTSVAVIGSFLTFTLPSWTCYLDGNAFPSNNISLNVHLNNVEICSSNGFVLKDTPRYLTVVASGTIDNPFLFDHIKYEPDASVILDNKTVVVDAFDDHIGYSSGWSSAGGIGMETSVLGSSLNFDFVGTRIKWVTTVALDSNITVNAWAYYSIDNGTPFHFPVVAQNSTVQQYNLVSFQTPNLPPGPHRLFVEYGINNLNGSAPLLLDYFMIQNVTGPLFTTSPPNTTTTTTTQSPTITPIFHRAGLSNGRIAGVVIGSAVGLALIISSLVWTIRFIKREKAAQGQPIPYTTYRNIKKLGREKEVNKTALTVRGAVI